MKKAAKSEKSEILVTFSSPPLLQVAFFNSPLTAINSRTRSFDSRHLFIETNFCKNGGNFWGGGSKVEKFSVVQPVHCWYKGNILKKSKIRHSNPYQNMDTKQHFLTVFSESLLCTAGYKSCHQNWMTSWGGHKTSKKVDFFNLQLLVGQFRVQKRAKSCTYVPITGTRSRNWEAASGASPEVGSERWPPTLLSRTWGQDDVR